VHRQLAGAPAAPYRDMATAASVGIEFAAMLSEPTAKLFRIHGQTIHNTSVKNKVSKLLTEGHFLPQYFLTPDQVLL
jgi:hypothetical protein